jgi:hypothetical protein
VKTNEQPAEPARPNLELIKAEAVQTINPIVAAARGLTITDDKGYNLADAFLAKIRTARKSDVFTRLRKIIDPIRAGLDELYAVERGIKEPLDEAEKQVKSKMRAWQLAEQERVRKEEEARRRKQEELDRQERIRQREIERLEREKQEAEERAQQARTRAARLAAQQQADELQRQQDEAAETQRKADALAAAVVVAPIAQPVKAASSIVRKTSKVRVTDIVKLAEAVGKGLIPETMIQIDQVQLNLMFKNNREWVSEWPGVEVYEDVEIAGRR